MRTVAGRAANAGNTLADSANRARAQRSDHSKVLDRKLEHAAGHSLVWRASRNQQRRLQQSQRQQGEKTPKTVRVAPARQQADKA